MTISRQFSYSQNLVLRDVTDEVGALIELAYPFTQMKNKGSYSPRKVIRAAAEYSVPLILKDGLTTEQSADFNYVYMHYRVADRQTVSSMTLDAATEQQINDLRSYVKSHVRLRMGLRVMDHGGRSFPDILMIFVCLLYMRDALRPIRLVKEYEADMRSKTWKERAYIKQKAKKLNEKGE